MQVDCAQRHRLRQAVQEQPREASTDLQDQGATAQSASRNDEGDALGQLVPDKDVRKCQCVQFHEPNLDGCTQSKAKARDNAQS